MAELLIEQPESESKNLISVLNDRSVLCLWWLSIPVYTIAVQYLKTRFLPYSTFYYNMHDLINRERYATLFLFLILPVILIIINSISIRKIYILSNHLNYSRLFWSIATNILLIIISILVILVYFH